MFSCDSIPENDDFANDYICGSTDLSESLVVFGSALFFACCAGLIIYLATVVYSKYATSESMFSSPRLQEHISRLRVYMTCIDRAEQAADNMHLQPIISLCRQTKQFLWHFVQLCLIMLVSSVPIYILRSTDDNSVYSTHTNTYAWGWTLAYMRGVVPAALILMSWTIAIGAGFYRIILSPLMVTTPAVIDGKSMSQSSSESISGKPSSNGNDDTLPSTRLSGVKKYSSIAAALLVNATVAVTVNALYVSSTHQPLPSVLHFGIQLSLAVFRLAYSYCVLPLLSASIRDPIWNIRFRLRLLVLNNLVIPCIVTAFASPSCFQVRLTYSIHKCSAPY